jgi:hypothetical protein
MLNQQSISKSTLWSVGRCENSRQKLITLLSYEGASCVALFLIRIGSASPPNGLTLSAAGLLNPALVQFNGNSVQGRDVICPNRCPSYPTMSSSYIMPASTFFVFSQYHTTLLESNPIRKSNQLSFNPALLNQSSCHHAYPNP